MHRVTLRSAIVPTAVLLAALPVPCSAQGLLTEMIGATSDQLGYSLAPAGDIDGDGFPDLVVGSPRAVTSLGIDDGVVWVASGRHLATGVGPARIHTWDGPMNLGLTPSRFGHAVAGGEDVDRDGVPDVLVGANNDDTGGLNGGSLSVYSGATGLQLATFTQVAHQAFGTSVAFAGDVNGDGWIDVMAGAVVNETTFGVGFGHVHVYSGEWIARTSAGQTPATPMELVSLLGLYNHSDFGAAVAPMGDLDADGLDDFAVGAKGGGTPSTGHVVIYRGGTTTPFVVASGIAANEFYGTALANVGDVDADGLDDLAVGAWGADKDPANSMEGRVDVVRGRWLLETGLGLSPSVTRNVWSRMGYEKYDVYGTTVAAIGDIDGDGAGEVGIGATQGLYGLSQGGGYVDVVSGRTGELLFRRRSPTAEAFFGKGLAGPGDIDGDGRRDIAMGIPFDAQGGLSSGSAIVVRGMPLIGTPVCAANATPNSSGTIARLVARGSPSQSADAVFLELTGAPHSRPVIFFRGGMQSQIPFGNGVWCAGGSVRRIGAGVSDATGAARRTFRLGTTPVGSTVVFQAWLDDAPAGGAGFNTSDASMLVVVP